MGDGDDAEPHEDRARGDRGPRGWVVLTITAVVLAAVVGGGLAVNRWVIDHDQAEEPPVTTEVDNSIEVEPVSAPSATRLFVRETEAGIEIRVHETKDNMMFGMPPVVGDDDRPGWCQPESMVMVSALSDNAVSQTQMPRTIEPAPDPAVAFGAGGVIEEAPLAVIVAQVDDTVASARMTHASGQIDSMEPIDGLIALAIEVPMPDPDANDPTGGPFGGGPFGVDTRSLAVEFVHHDGTSVRMTDQQLWNGVPMWIDPECNGGGNFPMEQPKPEIPELELPDPGVEQPDDPALETAAIEQSLVQLYADVDNDATLFSLLDDASGIDLLLHDVLDSEHGPKYRAMEATMTDIVFFSPVEASFVYTTGLDLYDDGFSGLFPEFGRARLINGVWMITRSTLCQDIAKSGRNCTI
jgi:hypothetical protein